MASSPTAPSSDETSTVRAAIQPASRERALNLIAWNIAHGNGFKRALVELERVFQVPNTIVALQEADTPQLKLGPVIGRWLNLHMHQVGRDVILSDRPLAKCGTFVINERNQRRATWADVELASGGLLRVYSVHLTYHVAPMAIFIPTMRGQEMEVVLAHAQKARDAAAPVVIMGDLNSVGYLLGGHGREPCVQRLLEAGYTDLMAAAPRATHLVLGRLDWIFGCGLRATGAVNGPFAGSDHRLLQVQAELSAAVPAAPPPMAPAPQEPA